MPSIAHIGPSSKPWSAGIVDEIGAIVRWPPDRPLACLVSSGELNAWNRYSVLACPSASVSFDPVERRTIRRDFSTGATDSEGFTHDPLEDLTRLLGERSDSSASIAPGWMGSLGYELGFEVEPTARVREREGDGWPLFTLLRVDGALVFDRASGAWSVVGDAGAVPELRDSAREPVFSCSPFVSATGRAGYEAAVARAVAYTHAGDVFQANIAHRLDAAFTGEPRGALVRALAGTRPWFGGYLEIPGETQRAVLSASPELFLSIDARGRVVTRPIKGTTGDERATGALLESEKNAAELAMIVDLMRNDLSRVCAPGTVRVTNPRELERHAHEPSIFHTTATIEGRLRDGMTRADALRAAFPPGSITGAPKVRAMQIIDELEPVARGAYTGSIGLFPDDGSMRASVAIRTASFERARTGAWRASYHAGAGIVSDSDPREEWLETLAKAGAFVRALGSEVSETP